MKIRVRPKFGHKTPLCTTIYTKIISLSLNPNGVFSALYYSIKLVLTHFILIKT